MSEPSLPPPSAFPDPTQMSPQRPLAWGPFLLGGLLGQGGMAAVYWGVRVDEVGNRHPVAVKVPLVRQHTVLSGTLTIQF